MTQEKHIGEIALALEKLTTELFEAEQYAMRLDKINAELLAALQNIMNGIETGAITSEQDETFANAVAQASAAIAKCKGAV